MASDSWTDEELLAFHFGELSDERAQSLGRELERSPDIRNRLAELRQLGERLTEAAAADPANDRFSPEVRQRLVRQVRDELRKSPSRQRKAPHRRMTTSGLRAARRQLRTRGPLPAIAAAAVLGLGLWVLFSFVPRGSSRTRKVAVTPIQHEPATPAPVAGHANDTSADGGQPLKAERPAEVPAAPAPLRPQEGTIQPLPIPQRAPGPVQGPRVAAVVAEEPQPKAQVRAEEPKRTPGKAAPATERPIARIVRVRGKVMYARGMRPIWLKAVAGIRLLSGDRLDTRVGMAQLDVGGAGFVFANQNTVLRVLAARAHKAVVCLLELVKGQVYVEDSSRRLHVATPDGLFSPVGTRFAVYRRLSGTVVLVEAGAVEVRTSRKTVKRPAHSALPAKSPVDLRGGAWVGQALRVEAGYQSRVRGGSAPAAPERIRGSQVGSWRKPLAPAREVILSYDFEDGLRPHPWQYGEVVQGPLRGGNRLCLAASGFLANQYPDSYRLGGAVRMQDFGGICHYAKGMVLRFECWVGKGHSYMTVSVTDGKRRQQFSKILYGVPGQTWVRVTLRLEDLGSTVGPYKTFGEGNPITRINISTRRKKGVLASPLYVDDLQVLRYPAESMPRSSWR